MSYDPTFPAQGIKLKSAEFRAQFNGLKDLIDAVPAGPPGQNGSDGTSVTGAVIDNTTTLNPGEAAQASVNWDGANVRFTFGIPRGQEGQAGQDGVSSPPITSFIVDGVNTLNPGDNATVQTSFDGANVRLLFGIPRGNDGTNGSNGNDGGQGPPFTNFIVDGVTTLNPGDPAAASANFDGSAVRLLFGIPRGQDGVSATPITSFIVDGVNTLNPGDNATVQTNFDGASVRFTFGIPRGSDGTNGSNGNDGGQGPPFTNFIVDGVNMLNPTDPASVQTVFDGNAVRMIFNLPRGFTGNDGSTGAQGLPGIQGPPFANAVVDSVTTLNPGDNATVQTNFDGSNVRFQFGIPRGNDGTGPQGPPGEVTNAQLSSAIAGTSTNSNGVGTLDTAFTNDPPTLADLELVRAKINELINALRR